jgi:hypothetical protein
VHGTIVDKEQPIAGIIGWYVGGMKHFVVGEE